MVSNMFSLFLFFSFFFLPFLIPRPVIAQTSRSISITSPSQNLTVHNQYYDFSMPTVTSYPTSTPGSPTNTPIPPSNIPVPSSPTPSPSPSAEMTVTDFWNGNAELKFAFKITSNSLPSLPGINAGVHMEVIGNTWYLFTRKVDWGNKPSYCPNNETMHLQVRKSTDNGKTWNQPVDVIGNTPNTPYECAATDGDAFYNQSENKWHYLFQCLDRRGLWSGCHAERFGRDIHSDHSPRCRKIR